MEQMSEEFVSASELARLGYRERQVAFDAACGPRTTPAQRWAQERGLRSHATFYQESQRIATASVDGQPLQQYGTAGSGAAQASRLR